MESTEKPHTNRHKYIMNDFNYDATNTLTSHKIYGLDNWKHLVIFFLKLSHTKFEYRHEYTYITQKFKI